MWGVLFREIGAEQGVSCYFTKDPSNRTWWKQIGQWRWDQEQTSWVSSPKRMFLWHLGVSLLLLTPESFYGKLMSKVELTKYSLSKPNSRISIYWDPGGFWTTIPGVSQVAHENGHDKDTFENSGFGGWQILPSWWLYHLPSSIWSGKFVSV